MTLTCYILLPTNFHEFSFSKNRLRPRYSNQFWKAFRIIWFGLSGENVKLTFQDILVGKLDKVSLKLQVSYC